MMNLIHLNKTKSMKKNKTKTISKLIIHNFHLKVRPSTDL